MSDCMHPNAQTRVYVGEVEDLNYRGQPISIGRAKTYEYCPDCFATWGGEEGAAKQALMSAAAAANVSEEDEVNGDEGPRR